MMVLVMMVFNEYAKFYDTLYEDKNYVAECDFLEHIFLRFATGRVQTILDLGCGTAGHALILADRGYKVTGVDRSKEMLEKAREKDSQNKVDLHLADMRKVNLGIKFDVVISMFAVMSYMITNEDLEAVFETTRAHLNPGGLFIFDAWFGPGVFSDPPKNRAKEIVRGDERLIRFAQPEVDVVRQVVTVNFRVLRHRGNQLLEDVKESHPMRPLFVQELATFAHHNGMKLIHACPFMEIDAEPSHKTWNITAIIANAGV